MIINSNKILNKGYNSNIIANKIFYQGSQVDGMHDRYVIYVQDGTKHIDFYDDGIVPQDAYSGNTGITSVETSNLTKIGNGGFYQCTSLSSVTINEGVETICDKAFASCSGLTVINLPNSLKAIGTEVYFFSFGAFGFCSSLTDIIIPDSVTFIGKDTFEYDRQLSYIIFGNTRTDIPTLENSNAFDNLPNNYKIVVPDALVENWKSASNWSNVADHIVSYSSSPSVKIIFNDNSQKINIYANGIVPNNVYSGNTTIKSVELNRISNVENNAFSGCSNLNTLVVNGDINSIGEGCFLGCDSLSYARFNGNVGKIGDYAFYNCSNLTYIGSTANFNELGAHAWDGIDLPSFYWNSVSTIFGEYALANNVNMTYINLPSGATESISNYCFYNCTSLSSITLCDEIETIGDGAFANCASLTNITMPSNLETIGNSAFSACTMLSSVTLNRYLNTIGDGAFANCSGLTSITTNQLLHTIGDGAFSGCTMLSSVTLNLTLSLQTIGNGAFASCTSLSSITIPNSVTSVGANTFLNCSNLAVIDFGDYRSTIPTLSNSNAFDGLPNNYRIRVPDALVDDWKNASNWSNVASHIVPW